MHKDYSFQWRVRKETEEETEPIQEQNEVDNTSEEFDDNTTEEFDDSNIRNIVSTPESTLYIILILYTVPTTPEFSSP